MEKLFGRELVNLKEIKEVTKGLFAINIRSERKKFHIYCFFPTIEKDGKAHQKIDRIIFPYADIEQNICSQ